MPAPAWNWAPQRASGNYEPGFDRRRPNEQVGWSPAAATPFPFVTEPGGAMLTNRGMQQAGMADFFTIPQGQQAQVYYDQQVQTGSMAPPPPGSPAAGPTIQPDAMDESALYQATGPARHAGSMAWEGGPAPWEQPGGQAALAPSAAPRAIAAANARTQAANDAKAAEAVKAAKIAADNAVRAAVAGAPRVAATNAATAQAAANVAAGVAQTRQSQAAAALAQSEATKAVAAANVAASNAHKAANGEAPLGDWLNLSGGLGGIGHTSMAMLDREVVFGLRVKHVLGIGAIAAAIYYKPWKKLGK
jgi:hypothetical protein